MKTILITCLLLILFVVFTQFFETLGSAQNTSNSPVQKPTIEVQCELFDIHDKPGDEAFYAMVRFIWKAQNADYVLIEGYDEREYPVEGQISVQDAGFFTFIAVSSAGITMKPINCVHKWKRGTGIHGLIHSVSTEFYDREFDPAYKLTFKTNLSKNDIKDRITRLLQERTYSSVEDKLLNAPSDDLFFHTSDYNHHQKLCYGDDCGRPIGKRIIERQVAFSIWVQYLARQNNIVTYRLHVRPYVMLNYRLQDRKWKVDTDADQIAKPISQELSEVIEAKLK